MFISKENTLAISLLEALNNSNAESKIIELIKEACIKKMPESNFAKK